jgi:hypothetical protein
VLLYGLPLFVSGRLPLPDSARPNFQKKFASEVGVVHEIAKLILEHAESLWERKEAVKKALYLGMPLHEIEEYLDWVTSVRRNGQVPPDASHAKEPDHSASQESTSEDGGDGAN